MNTLEATDLQKSLGAGWTVCHLAGRATQEACQREIDAQRGSVLLLLDEVDSTSRLAKSLQLGQHDGRCMAIVAKTQTAGYGRSGRSWHAQPGSALTLTILQPGAPLINPGLLPLLAGCAVAAMFRAFIKDENDLDLKWPNDVWLKGLKAAGVLVESHLRGGRADLFFGIGCNIGQMSFPMDVRAQATTLADHIMGEVPSLVICLTHLLAEHERIYKHYVAGNGDAILEEFAGNSSFVSGRAISYQINGQKMQGTTTGLSPTGELLCRDEDGRDCKLNVSEIQLLR